MHLPSDQPVQALQTLDVGVLVNYLESPVRSRLVVLLTVPQGARGPLIDPAEVAEAAGGQADVVTLPTDNLTHELANRIGKEASAFRGACRIYPPGTDWLADPRSTILHLAMTKDQCDRLPRELLADLNRQLAQAARQQAATTRAAKAARGSKAARTGSGTSGTGSARPDGAPSPGPKSTFGYGQSGQVRRIDAPDEAAKLANHLLAPGRTSPAVVLSWATGAGSAFPDAEALAKDLTGLADVFEITRPSAAWALSEGLPEGWQTYGGASRVYPVGLDWANQPGYSRLHTAYSLDERAGVTQAILSDALNQAALAAAATPQQAKAKPAGGQSVGGEVMGWTTGRVMVQLDNGDYATIWPELVTEHVTADRLFKKRMHVEGVMDRQSKRIDIDAMKLSPEQALAAYQAGATVPVRVAKINAGNCVVELFPGVEASIEAIDIAEDQDLRLLMTRGETILVRVIEHGDGWLLSANEAAPAAEAQPAASILRGGPPWLDPTAGAPAGAAGPGDIGGLSDGAPAGGAGAASGGEAGGGPAYDLSDPTTLLQGDLADAHEVIGGLWRELNQATRQLKRLEAEYKTVTDQAALARTKRREAELELAKLRKAKGGAAAGDDQGLFLDPADQLDFEIRQAWARRIQPADKAAYPLPKSWTYAPQFFETLDQTQGIDRSKVVDVIVEVLTDRAVELASRGVHQLRTGQGGDNPVRKSPDGGTYWRVYLQSGTPSARRLHYLKRPDGSIELCSVRVHDDDRT
ncbi:MAG: hypothetical protein LBR27_03720 [Bifidobacteriaceae bacterium]|jgi:hypothetical protein|nr:hypothetical protein [Bifidobacteriaceae bacterium]